MSTRTRARSTHCEKRKTRSHKGGGESKRESEFLSLAALSPDLQEVARRSSSMYAEPGDIPKNVFQGTRSVKSMEIERNVNKQVLAYIFGGFALGGITYAISTSVDIKQ